MKVLSISDIIGPIMIGPSSSHTAGALRIAQMARKLLTAEPRCARFTLYGSFAHTYQGHGTDKALVAGMLGYAPDDVRIRDSFVKAQEHNLNFEFITDAETYTNHPNTVDIYVEDAAGTKLTVRGESIGGGAAIITRLNGTEVYLDGAYHSMVVCQQDVRGVLAHITSCLSQHDINIATTSLFREKRGDRAYTILQTDDEIPACLIDQLQENPDIHDVCIVKKDSTPDGGDCGCEQGYASDFDTHTAAIEFTKYDFHSGEELLDVCSRYKIPISEAMCRRERCYLAMDGIDPSRTRKYLCEVLKTMQQATHEPLDIVRPSMGGLLGGEAKKARQLETSTQNLCDPLLSRAVTYAMAVMETNASMGRIVATPTAGSAGVLPAMLQACRDKFDFSDDELVDAIANAAAIGYIITRNACVSGAEGGCQAEVGSASAMAASAAVELMGGTPEQCLSAATNALSGLMGLVCDPIAGLVEAPCQKRNATGVANALVSAQMALAHIENLVPFDQAVEAMYRVGKSLPFELRESALGGMAATPAAQAWCSHDCSSCPGC